MLTHWGRDKMDAILQTTFSNAFYWMRMFKYRLKFHWSLFLRVQLTISQHWFRWLGADQATSHYLDQWWLDYRRIYASLGLNELRCLKSPTATRLLFSGLPRLTTQKSSDFSITEWLFLNRIQRWTKDVPHKWPVMRKVFPCHDVTWTVFHL